MLKNNKSDQMILNINFKQSSTKTNLKIMKKSFLLMACATLLSMSIFAQTPQSASTSTKAKSEKSAQVKKDKANTQSSKDALAKDKSKEKSDVANLASTQTKKTDKKQVKADKATVKANKKTEKKDKKTASKKAPTSPASKVS